MAYLNTMFDSFDVESPNFPYNTHPNPTKFEKKKRKKFGGALRCKGSR
jgi:hypothetical protein